jgi:hypothetical protein
MNGAGITLTAEAGDGDPLSALADALAQFPADEILICTLPVERSHWLERDIIGRAESLFPVPVTHIIATDHADHSGALAAAGHSAHWRFADNQKATTDAARAAASAGSIAPFVIAPDGVNTHNFRKVKPAAHDQLVLGALEA